MSIPIKIIARYEDYSDIIDRELCKRKGKWTLTAITSFDWDDVCQIIRLHIFKKLHQYDTSRPILPWINAVISSQIKNLIRNNYSNYTRPCLRCDAAVDNDKCKIYGKQCDSCPLFKDWQKRKLPAHNVKLPVSIENHVNEVSQVFDESINYSYHLEKIHSKMKEILKPLEYKIYEGLFILNEEEDVIAKRVGYISSEKGRGPGYKQFHNVRKIIIAKIKRCMEKGELDL